MMYTQAKEMSAKTRSQKQQGTIFPYRFQRKHDPAHTLPLRTYHPQNHETINLYLKPSSSGYIVTGAQEANTSTFKTKQLLVKRLKKNSGTL